MQILFIHRAGSLGDRIRVENILKVLKERGFSAFEAGIPSISPADFKETSLNLLRYMLPFHNLKLLIDSRRPNFYLDLNISLNFLKNIRRKVNFDVIFAQSLVGWSALELSKETSVPCVIDAHGLVGAEAKGRNTKHWRVLEELEAEVFRGCAHLLVVSRAMKEYIVSHFDVKRNKITVIPNGSDVQTFTSKYDFPLKVIYAGNFSYWEKVEDYLEIAKNADQKAFKFILAGDGPQKEDLLRQIEREKISIQYLGCMSRHEILKVMSTCQVGIAPSTRDLSRIVAFPIKVLDYMACGLPVIAPKVGDWGEMLERENCGIPVEEDKVEDYLEALEVLKNKEIWLEKSRNGIRAIETKYNWNKILFPITNVLVETSKIN